MSEDRTDLLTRLQGQETIEVSNLSDEELVWCRRHGLLHGATVDKAAIERMLIEAPYVPLKGRGKYRRRVVLEALLAWCTLELLAELDEEDKAAVLQGIVTPGETDE